MRIENLIGPQTQVLTIVDDSGRYPGGRVLGHMLEVARRLQRHEVARNEVVALLADNGVGFVVGLLGIVASSAAAALIDPALPLEAIRRVISGSRARILCWSGNRPAGYLLQCPELSSSCQPIDVLRIDENREQREDSDDPRPLLGDDGPALVVYSSGTTGEPKGIVLSHRAITSNVRAIAEYLEPSHRDSFLIVKSMVHSSTIVGEVLVAVSVGARIIALNPLVAPSQLFRRIREHRPTIIGLNPSILRFFINGEVRASTLESLRLIHVSGSIIDREIQRKFSARFPFIRLINGYGLTEAGPRVTHTPRSAEHKLGSVGRPLRDVQVEVTRVDGDLCRPGEVGEILVHSPSLFDGYLVGGKLQKRIPPDGLLRTGDIGYLDEDGDLFITGRVDDLILTGSHNVNPADVEAVVQQVEGVADCVVFGVDDELLGQRIVCAYIAERKTTVEASHLDREIRATCARELAHFQSPKTFLRWDSIPTGPGGKKSRRLARQLFSGARLA